MNPFQKSKYFAAVAPDESGIYWSGDVTLSGVARPFSLYIETQICAAPERLAVVASRIEQLDALNTAGLGYIHAGFAEKNDVLLDYLAFHRDEIVDELAEFFGNAPEDLTDAFLVNALKLSAIGIHPGDTPETYDMTLDYVLTKTLSDQLITIGFDANGPIYLSHES